MKKVIVVALFLAFTQCSPDIRVYSDYDPEYHLWDYTTFTWEQSTNIESGKNPLYYNELNDKRIKSAVDEQLIKRGYALSTDKTGLVIHYHIVIDNASVLEHYGYYSPYSRRMRTNYYQYKEGTLILDLMDPKTNSTVWRGWAVSVIDEAYTQPEIDKLIKKAVEKIFKKFPTGHPNPALNEKINVLGDLRNYKQ